MTDDRTDRFDPSACPTSNCTLILGDINVHYPSWDVSCVNPDKVGRRVFDWTGTVDWRVLNSGAPTRAGYGDGTRLTAPDVALAHRNLARRCTWTVGEDLGSDHLPQVVTTTAEGSLPRRTRKTKWAFHKANWPAFTADCEVELSRIPVQDLDVEALSQQMNQAITDASRRWVPRRARTYPELWAMDPELWAMDPDLVSAVRARREARSELQEDPSEEARTRWKEAKRTAAEAEMRARQKSFRDFAITELNQPAAIGKVSKILKKMEGVVRSVYLGQAVNGDRGQLAVEDRAKTEAFIPLSTRPNRQS